MPQFELFRIRVAPTSQLGLFAERLTPSELLRNAIESRPSFKTRPDIEWHIGNIKAIDERALLFAIGRTSPQAVETYDEGLRDFVETAFDVSPYTHAVVDTSLEVCAIAAKARLAPTTSGIARQLAHLLRDSSTAREHGVRFTVDQISDPEEFLHYLRTAYAIQSFTLTFRPPNAFDANSDFTKPFQRYLEATGGKRGQAVVTGGNLNHDTLETLTRSAAALGDDAKATVVPKKGDRRVRKALRGGNFTTLFVSEEDIVSEPGGVVDKVRELYRKVRGNDG